MQKIMKQKIIMTISVGMLALSIIACASTRDSKRVVTEKMLQNAGFKKGSANTPQELARLKKLPQRKIIPHEDGGKTYYIYVDLKNCNCAYVGDEEAYQKYQERALQKRLAEEDRRNEVRDRQRMMDSNDSSYGRDW